MLKFCQSGSWNNCQLWIISGYNPHHTHTHTHNGDASNKSDNDITILKHTRLVVSAASFWQHMVCENESIFQILTLSTVFLLNTATNECTYINMITVNMLLWKDQTQHKIENTWLFAKHETITKGVGVSTSKHTVLHFSIENIIEIFFPDPQIL